MLDIDDYSVKKYEKDLKTFARKAFPHAVRFTLNKAAFETRTEGQANIRRNMTTRNRFTEQSVRVNQAKGMNVDNLRATVGSVAEYMERQEFGGVARGKGKYGAVIPTSYAAGQQGQIPRTKLPRKANSIQQIQLRKRVRAARSARQFAFLTGLIAAREGDKFVFIPGGSNASSGIYRVWGRDKKRGQFRGIKLKMLYSMRQTPTRTPREPWLSDATKKKRKQMQAYYRDALLYQLQRQGVFGY